MKLQLLEWSWSNEAIIEHSKLNSLSPSESTGVILKAACDIQRSFNMSSQPIEISIYAVRPKGIAGIIGLDGFGELEIVPKYSSSNNSEWKSDLLFISLCSKYGNLFEKSRIQSSSDNESDLLSFLAKALIDGFKKHRRTPLKKHRIKTFEDYEIVGDFEAEDIYTPNHDGFAQKSLTFDSSNEFMSTIKNAAKILYALCKSSRIRNQLGYVIYHIGSVASKQSSSRKKLPNRLKSWQPVYDLSFDICQGYGAGFKSSAHRMPGFIIDTWRTWEDLVSISLFFIFGSGLVVRQEKYHLGTVIKDGSERNINTIPDLIVEFNGERIIVDAKYKGRSESSKGVLDSDIYEAMAFMRATEIKTTVLIYPETSSGKVSEAGYFQKFQETHIVGGEKIIAVSLGINRISSNGGFHDFCSALKKAILSR